MSAKSVILSFMRLPALSNIIKGKVVDYHAMFDMHVADGKATEHERVEHIRAMMNMCLTRVTQELVDLYRDDRERFKEAFPIYLNFALDPVYMEIAPEAVVSSLILMQRVPRKLRCDIDPRADEMISRLNVGGLYPTKTTT